MQKEKHDSNNAEHQAPADVSPSSGDGVPDGAVTVHDDGDRNDPTARNLRVQHRRGNKQTANCDPIDGGGLPNHPQQAPYAFRLDMRPGEHMQLGNGSVNHGNENGGHARGLKCQVSHLGYVLSGRMRVYMDDGSEVECGPGDVVALPRGHDAEVIGDEACEMVDFGEFGEYAKR